MPNATELCHNRTPAQIVGRTPASVAGPQAGLRRGGELLLLEPEGGSRGIRADQGVCPGGCPTGLPTGLLQNLSFFPRREDFVGQTIVFCRRPPGRAEKAPPAPVRALAARARHWLFFMELRAPSRR
jgi:hypothetical protein